MSANYIAKDLSGNTVCVGNAENVASILKITTMGLVEAYNNNSIVKGKYLIYKADDKDLVTPSKLHDHLFREDGGRAYEYKQGYPNRYKDASCVRFTPL